MSVVKNVFGDVEVPEISLTTALFMKFEEYGNKVAMVDAVTDRKLTYAQLIDSSRRVASGFAKLGLKKGDIVSFYSYNTLEWVCVLYGVLLAGGTVTTVNPAYTKYELEHQLNDTGSKFLYTVKEFLPRAKEACKGACSVQRIIGLGCSPSDCIPLDHLLNDDCSKWSELQNIEINPREDVALVPFSSGTTGLPKGVMLTHYNILANMLQLSHPNYSDPDKLEAIEEGNNQEVTMAVIPFYHAFGLVGICIFGLGSGGTFVVLPKFEPKLFLRSIEKYKVTAMLLVPPLVLFLAQTPLVNNYDLSSVTRVLSGAAPLSKDIERKFAERLKVKEMKQGFGMTETTVGAIGHSVQKPGRVGSCGMLIPGSQAKIVDPDTGKVLGPNERGELLYKGPQVMKGYLNNPEATRNTIDSEGYLHTGDVAYYDTDGYFFIVDRMKELIKVKGLQVAPAELEALLLTHPGIVDAGVTGIPDERAGELPRAFVVKKQGAELSETQVYQYTAEKTAAFKHLKGGVQFVNEIPRLQSGKIIRRKLKELTISKI